MKITFRDIVKNLALTFISTIVALVVCEIIIRNFVAVRNVGPDYTAYDPTYGKRLKKNFTALRITPEFSMKFATNSLGFRGPEPDEFPYRPILFLGDSFTEGYGVNDGEEFPELVRKALAKKYGNNVIPAVNAGMEDAGNGHWVKFLRNEAGRYAPRLVVLQLMANDFRDNIEDRLFRLNPDGGLAELPVPQPDMKRILKKKLFQFIPGLEYSYLLGFAGQTVTALHRKWTVISLKHNNMINRVNRKAEDLTYQIVEEALRICEKNSWPVFVLTVSIGGERLNGFEKIFSSYRVPFAIVPDAHQRPDLYYSADGHWNAAGHAYVADLILKQLPDFDIRRVEDKISLQTNSLNSP